MYLLFALKLWMWEGMRGDRRGTACLSVPEYISDGAVLEIGRRRDSFLQYSSMILAKTLPCSGSNS